MIIKWEIGGKIKDTEALSIAYDGIKLKLSKNLPLKNHKYFCSLWDKFLHFQENLNFTINLFITFDKSKLQLNTESDLLNPIFKNTKFKNSSLARKKTKNNTFMQNIIIIYSHNKNLFRMFCGSYKFKWPIHKFRKIF